MVEWSPTRIVSALAACRRVQNLLLAGHISSQSEPIKYSAIRTRQGVTSRVRAEPAPASISSRLNFLSSTMPKITLPSGHTWAYVDANPDGTTAMLCLHGFPDRECNYVFTSRTCLPPQSRMDTVTKLAPGRAPDFVLSCQTCWWVPI